MGTRRTQLRYLTAVAREGQMTSAARTLGVAQPTLSQAIAQLESEVGAQLLERHSRGVTLTPAGSAFLQRARVAVSAEDDVAQTAGWLARSAQGSLTVGFVGPPPAVTAPRLLDAFAGAHPQAQVSLLDLPFPSDPISEWLKDVDMAFCHAPELDEGVVSQPVRVTPRAVVLAERHPLSGRPELTVGDVVDERFISYDPGVQARWAGFHSLDDHRGGPPPQTTEDRVRSSLQMAGTIAQSRAITTVPHCDAAVAAELLPGVTAIPIRDARPAVLSLVWRGENSNPLVRALVQTAARLGQEGYGL
jgi:DNA-binding transcriptional LysR family regulator